MQQKVADLAQLVEQLICNHQVVGSSPTVGSIFFVYVPGSQRYGMEKSAPEPIDKVNAHFCFITVNTFRAQMTVLSVLRPPI